MQKNISILDIMKKIRRETVLRRGGIGEEPGELVGAYVGDVGDVSGPIYKKNEILMRGGEKVPNVPNVPAMEPLSPAVRPSPPILILDFETYFDAEYSLKKLHIPEYVFAPQFKIHGLAVAYPDGRAEFHSDAAAVIEDLQKKYGVNLEKALVVMHNAAFDLFILFHKFGVIPLLFTDTMLLSRLLLGPTHPAGLKDLAQHFGFESKGDLGFMCGVSVPSVEQVRLLSEYAKTDVWITLKLAKQFLLNPDLPSRELAIIAHTVRSFVRSPFEIDGKLAVGALGVTEALLKQSTAQTGYSLGEYSGRKSFSEVLSTVLKKHGRSLPTKPDKNGRPIPAVAKDDIAMQALLNDPVEEIRDIAEAKMIVAATPNIMSKLMFLKNRATLPGAKLYPELAYHRAQTGRFAGSGGFNIQNLGHGERSEYMPTEIVTAISEGIGVPEGCVLVASDASQIEARILTLLAGESELHNAFATGNDVYSDFAAATFGEKVQKSNGTSLEEQRMRALRQVGKMAVLGLGYGMGASTFEKNLRSTPSVSALFDTDLLDTEKCERLVNGYRRKYQGIPGFWREAERSFRMAIAGVA